MVDVVVNDQDEPPTIGGSVPRDASVRGISAVAQAPASTAVPRSTDC